MFDTLKNMRKPSGGELLRKCAIVLAFAAVFTAAVYGADALLTAVVDKFV